jgi:hypothetical protein
VTAALVVVAYALGAGITARVTWRILGGGLGHHPDDGRRVAEAALFWPITALAFVLYKLAGEDPGA